jgi:hypothetical protein
MTQGLDQGLMMDSMGLNVESSSVKLDLTPVSQDHSSNPAFGGWVQID